MRDWERGRQIGEELIFQTFREAPKASTGREMTFVSQGESPDFEAIVDGVPTGVEVTEIRKEDGEDLLSDADDLFATVYRIAAKKDVGYRKRTLFQQRPIILVCYSYRLPFWDIQADLAAVLVPEESRCARVFGGLVHGPERGLLQRSRSQTHC